MTRQGPNTPHVNVQGENIDAFGERIRVAIKRAGGATNMAEMADVSTSVLSKWRRGESEPTRRHLIRMAAAAKVPMSWLATGEGEPDLESAPRGEGSELDLSLLEEVARVTFEELHRRKLQLEPTALARLLRVLYWHFANRREPADAKTIHNIIDLAAYREHGGAND